jgi:5'-3' exonuclease
MHVLIDGDILLYRIGFTTEDTDFNIAKWRMNELIDTILSEIPQVDEYSIYLSDTTTNGFRYQIDPTYKPKPKYYEGLKYYLVTEEAAICTPEQEADDILGIEQTKFNMMLENPEYGGDGSCICSIDKDLLQIPGNHYNFVKKEKRYVDPAEGLRNFYLQLLIGDVADNIKGVYGIGPKKAEKAFEACSKEEEYFKVVAELYEHDYVRLLKNGQLLKIRTRKDELWTFPKAYQNVLPKTEDLSSSLPTKEAAPIQS